MSMAQTLRESDDDEQMQCIDSSLIQLWFSDASWPLLSILLNHCSSACEKVSFFSNQGTIPKQPCWYWSWYFSSNTITEQCYRCSCNLFYPLGDTVDCISKGLVFIHADWLLTCVECCFTFSAILMMHLMLMFVLACNCVILRWLEWS